MKVDRDYRRYRAKLEPSLEYPSVIEPDSRP
jgi:hypothetical protein